MNKLYKLLLGAQFLSLTVAAQNKTFTITENIQPQPKANYQLASRFSPNKLKKMVYSTTVDPHWLKLSNRLWYTFESPKGKFWYLVDPAAKSKKLMFDNAKLAADITLIIRDPFDAEHLPLENLKFAADEKSISFEIKSSVDELKKDRKDKKAADSMQKKIFSFKYELASAKLTEVPNFSKPKPKPSWGSVAPDSSAIIFSRNYNLYWMDKDNYKKAVKNEDDSTIVEHQLTKDGVKFYSYGSDGDGENNVENEKNNKKRRGAYVLWSPNSKYFVLDRTDSRKVKDLWVINSVTPGRPTLETYKYQMPGEAEAPQDEILLFDFAAKSYKKLSVAAFKDQSISVWGKPSLNKDRDNEFRPSIWLGNDSRFYFSRTSRDLKRIDIGTVDIATGKVTPLIDERFNTYVEVNRPGLVNDGKELIHWSERDGWAHFYLFDGNGKLKNQITKGAFHCESIVNIDEKKRILYFTANGREGKEDPYYLHLYSINFDGSNMKLLNAGDFDHLANMNDNNTFFVDNYSRVNTAPKATLYDGTGKKVMDLETIDLSLLMTAGYKFPEPFKVKADDGITDLYGVMYKPFDFDPNKKYPIIEYVYPGPQTEAVNKAFSKSMDRTERLAQFGYIVITVGNRGGNPSRSKWYHTYGYGNLRDYGLADKKTAVEQLAAKYSYIDESKVGITGHSGGGFMSTAAMLVYPDFFKAAVSNAGNHDNSIYNRWWSEKHHGVKETISLKGDTSFKYSIDKNPDLAKNLKGHLLLMHGDVDNNVHPANSIRVANALMKAGKRFDFLIIPGQRHGFGDMTEYAFWKLADHFNKYLIGDFSDPSDVDLVEMDRDIEQNGK
ncbi:S9 family peptidase [Pedobacter alluvionis]|uniref:Dipeptidyl aminopeptidase/acylaminoacyl peptidase n=1 Tax=Pedobacter alluvionis TaxID=475253 RepID=A0A497YG47_9SPHI|nr:DPP IV N-terminal domain-containing protein [Pedobacter alluvionis]RLJ80369.1 dipeptidyl aminopeptidase/acylaminoacyl peptidase [Pedobacter alluvionis]TFB31639.1 S9 family peptidase [Pedobacter alluvionis]